MSAFREMTRVEPEVEPVRVVDTLRKLTEQANVALWGIVEAKIEDILAACKSRARAGAYSFEYRSLLIDLPPGTRREGARLIKKRLRRMGFQVRQGWLTFDLSVSWRESWWDRFKAWFRGRGKIFW